MSKSAKKFFQMLGKAIIAAYLPMGKLVLGNRIQWLAMVPTRELYQFLVNKYLNVLAKIKIKIKNIKSMFLCFKSIIKEFKIFSYQSTSVQNKVLKLGKAKLWVSMSKDYQSIMLIHMPLLNKKCRKEEKTDLLQPLR